MSKRQKPDQNELLEKMANDFLELISNKSLRSTSIEHFLSNLIDDMTLGIIFDEHRKYKTDAYDLEADDSVEYEDSIDTDILHQQNFKKNRVVCICPNNCTKRVAATKFASHLETCMGLGRTKKISRRAASNIKDRGDTSSYSGIHSDDDDDVDDNNDDDDVDWNSTERKTKQKKRSGNKKNKGTPKKNEEHQQREHIDNNDVDEAYNNLRDLLNIQDQHSNSNSPAGVSSASGTRRNKAKKKNKQKDRSSPRSYF